MENIGGWKNDGTGRMVHDQELETHLGILTKCGIHNDFARKIIAMPDAELADAIAKFGATPNQTTMQTALIAAADAEINYRKQA